MFNNNNRKIFFFLLTSYVFLFILWTIFSFVFTDPNLILINQEFFVNWQSFLWQNILPNTFLRIIIFLILSLTLFINYLYLIKFWPKKIDFFNKKIIFVLISIFSILLISYNALSHDVFNYIFNARMLVKYGANPHQVTALKFAYDPWTRFMNNVHTTAPYGQVWTYISIIPYLLGFNKFFLTWLNFKVFAFLGLLITFYLLNQYVNKERNKYRALAILFLNPLILIETLGNAHNDWWMMWPVLASLLLVKKFFNSNKKNYFLIIGIVCLMFFSILTKFASLIAIPYIIYLLMRNQLEKLFQKNFLNNLLKFVNYYFWDLISISFFLPLFTDRSQRFLTWYLIWPMTFLPLLKSKMWKNILLIFSASAFLSYIVWIIYVPWLYFDRSLPNVLLYKQVILWLPALIYSFSYLFFLVFKHAKNKR